jgi:hypothetical protein
MTTEDAALQARKLNAYVARCGRSATLRWWDSKGFDSRDIRQIRTAQAALADPAKHPAWADALAATEGAVLDEGGYDSIPARGSRASDAQRLCEILAPQERARILRAMRKQIRRVERTDARRDGTHEPSSHGRAGQNGLCKRPWGESCAFYAIDMDTARNRFGACGRKAAAALSTKGGAD